MSRLGFGSHQAVAAPVCRADGKGVGSLKDALGQDLLFEVFGGADRADRLLVHQRLVELGTGRAVEVGELGTEGLDRSLELLGKDQRLQLQLVAL